MPEYSFFVSGIARLLNGKERYWTVAGIIFLHHFIPAMLAG
jgi:hypothetical protein